MKTETLERIKTLSSHAKSLATYFERFNRVTAEPGCDKYKAKFGGDGRFTVFRVDSVAFTAYTGYYGNSSCSTFGGMNSDLVRKHFLAALNAHKEALFATMAETMRHEAAQLTSKAEEELSALQALLDEATAQQEPAA